MPITLTAVLCPVPATPSTLCNPAADDPTGSPILETGQTTGLRLKFNEAGCRIDLGARWSGGAYAVVYGLAISAGSGLNVNVAAGQAAVETWVTKTTTTAVPVAASKTRVYLYLMADGSFQTVNESLTAPSGACCFIGSCVTDGSGVTSVDDSGVLRMRGATIIRQTADISVPTDTPPSTLSYVVQGVTKSWLWDGTRYMELGPTVKRVAHEITADDHYTLTETQYEATHIEITDSVGPNLTVGKNIILPTIADREWFVNNETAQTLTFKTAAGSGIGVAAGKCAHLYCNGVSIKGGVFA